MVNLKRKRGEEHTPRKVIHDFFKPITTNRTQVRRLSPEGEVNEEIPAIDSGEDDSEGMEDDDSGNEDDAEVEEWGGIGQGLEGITPSGTGIKPIKPTGEEIRAIKDAADLYRSNSFKLQVR
jgi:U3 small nucleolar RNA-associated protein 22